MTQRKPLLLLGAGDMATTYAYQFRDHARFDIAGFVQDADPALKGTRVSGLPVLAVEEALKLKETHAVLCATGSTEREALLAPFEEAGFDFATLIASTAIVHAREGLEPGCVVSDLANIDPNVRLGRYTIVTSRVTLGHHTTVGPVSFLAPGATIGGHCAIGKRCFIGMGALIRDHVTVGAGASVGAGAVVTKDVPAGVTVVGNPARPLEKRTHAAARRRPLLFLGAGTMAENYDVLFSDDPGFEIVGFVQDANGDTPRGELRGKPVYTVEEALKLHQTHAVISCMGSTKKRAMIERFEAAGFRFATLIRPSAKVHPEASLGPGCFVNHDSSVAPFTRVGAHTMIMRRVVLGHHSTIGPFSSIGAGALIAGSVRIGSGCFIGIGAVISDHISIGDNVTIGAGAVVVKDVPSDTTVVGNPARAMPPKPLRS